MRYPLALAILFAGMTQVVTAADSAPFEWTQEKFARVAAGDSTAGAKLVKKYRCSKCHNETGISDDEDIPSIAGQRATYIYKQFMDFKHKVRDNRDMYKVARKLDEKQIIDISAWFAEQKGSPMVGGTPHLVVKICDSCHNEDIIEKGDRIEVAPIIKGQMKQYIEDTMLAFKQSDRDNDLFSRMQSVAHKLSPKEINRIATYYGAKEIPEDD